MITEFRVTVLGRPAPQGSKRIGAQGQMREQSVYLPAWRAAVRRAVYERYREMGVTPEDLPLFRGAVKFGASFLLATGQRIDGPPDLDKLLRSTWDALTSARVWEDDARVVELACVRKVHAPIASGAEIIVWGLGE